MRIEESILNGIIVRNVIYEDVDFCTEEEKSNRVSVCSVCEYKKQDSCEKCHCLLVSLHGFKTSKCPENKW
jgi:hypothetical protein